MYPRLLPDTQEFQEIQDKVIDVVYERPTDYHEKIEIPFKAIEDIDEKFVQEEIQETKIVQERAVIPTEKIADRDDEKIDLVAEEELPIVQQQIITLTERIADDEKIDLAKEEEIVQETAVIQEQVAIPIERDYDEEEIDLIKEEELVTETTVVEFKEIPIEKPEILDEDEIERVATAKIELELPQELEEYCN